MMINDNWYEKNKFYKAYRTKLERSLDEVIHTNEKNHREVEVEKTYATA